MAFGQAAGPPASRRQLDELLALVQRAGFADFREARHPLDFTQRQASGKFTRDEADAYIAQLCEDNEDVPDDESAPRSVGDVSRSVNAPVHAPVSAAERRAAAQKRTIREFPSEVLAAELQRRGWAVMEP